ncbi:unnamed protein product, partial [Staurois parvus]
SAHQCHVPVPNQCHISVPISVTYQCQSVPPNSASQCRLSVPVSAAYQCHISVSCISAAFQCPSVMPVKPISATYQCPSVPPISVHQCSLSMPITAASL